MLSLLIGLFVVLPVGGGMSSTDHDIHLSVTEVRWNEAQSSFEMSIKIFIDDLELALAREQITGLYIGTEKESASANQHIASYLSKYFSIAQDGLNLQQHFVGKEIAEDFQAVWCYVELKGNHAARECTITNKVLLDLYDDQRNIMDIRMHAKHKAYTILDHGRPSWHYTY
jgi:hypothetical protein